MNEQQISKIGESVSYISQLIGGHTPFAGIILGSGLGELAEKIEDKMVIPYSDIPNFMKSTVVGHSGNLIAGMLGGKFVLAMQGRFHYYEGYGMDEVTLPVRVMVRLGISVLMVSNAAGGVNPDFRVGDLMLIRDHINLMPNPLVGPNMDEFGTRFPDMTRPYDLDIIALAEKLAFEQGISLKKGVYLASTGPTYETPAEYSYFRIIGADAVGMSTIPEVIVARHSSIPVFGMSVITNEAFGFTNDFLNDGEDVVRAANAAAGRMSKLFIGIIAGL